MKRLLLVFTCILMLTSCAGRREEISVSDAIKQLYPDAQITVNGDYYEIISSVDVDLTQKINIIGVAEYQYYEDMDALYEDMDLISNIAFRGVKTGESKQYIEFY